MNIDRIFLSDILEHPENDTPRLIFADWLDDHGDPERGEFIRAQCELARLPIGDLRRAELEVRTAALLKRHRRAWTPDLGKGVKKPELHRGFVEGVTLTATTFLKRGKDLAAKIPLRRVRLSALTHPLVLELADSGLMSRLTALALTPHNLGNTWLKHLLGPNLTGLRELDLSCNWLGTEGLRHLLKWRGTKGLTHLSLASRNFGAEEDDSLRQLKELLELNHFGDTDVKALVRSPNLANLTVLDLSGNRVGDLGAAELASGRLASLLDLNLADNRIGDPGAIAFGRSTGLRRLVRLDLRRNPISQGGAAALRAASTNGNVQFDDPT